MTNVIVRAKVKLNVPPGCKILAIKRWREVFGCGLKEAKDAVETTMGNRFNHSTGREEAAPEGPRFLDIRMNHHQFNALLAQPGIVVDEGWGGPSRGPIYAILEDVQIERENKPELDYTS